MTSYADILIWIPRIEYAKKKEKKQLIKFIKDETVPRDDVYKSHTVHVPTGESASSQSRPVPRPKPGQAKPITQGKLLRKGGPSNSVCRRSKFVFNSRN
jgi:myosin-1